jgi:FlaA1/EpsC-like NDP-sugar epimerase
MIETSEEVGGSLCPEGDVRVTNFGRFLRRTKINELPQLFNILKGEMSFVGPRPEAPDLAELYSEEAKILFSVKPGLVGPSQILNRNEEELYPEDVDLKKYYIKQILPKKIKVDLEYVNQATLFNYLKYILLAIKETLFGAISRRHFFENRSQIYLFLSDLAFVFGCYVFAIILRFESSVPEEDLRMFVTLFPLFLFYRIVCFIGFGLYGVLIRYINLQTLTTVAKAVTVSSLLTALTIYAMGYHSFPRSIYVIDWLCLNFFMGFVRFPGKFVRNKMYGKKDDNRKRVLIYGAGDKGNLAVEGLKKIVRIVGFLDDDRSKRNKKIQEFKIMGNRYDIEPLSKIYRIDEVILAVSNLDEKNLNHIISICNKARVGYSMLTALVDSYFDRLRQESLHYKKIYNWLGCEDIETDLPELKEGLYGKNVLVIAASNRLGIEFLKNLVKGNPEKVVLLDKYESYLLEALQSLSNIYPKERIRSFLFDSEIRSTAERIFQNEKPHIVIHMGTRKYASLMEIDPLKLIRENIVQTWDIMQMAEQYDSELFMMTSSIVAEAPENLIESTLKLSECYLQSCFQDSRSKGAIVRLYHLLENRGGIIPYIQNQVQNGRRILLNYPEDRGYFLTVETAAKVILLATLMALNGNGSGSIYTPLFNGPARVLDVVKLIIEDLGLDPGKDIQIDYEHPGSARKWEERILLDGQNVQDTRYEQIKLVCPSTHLSKREAIKEIERFRSMMEAGDRDQIYMRVNELMNLKR